MVKFISIAQTDIGIRKDTNQDSVLIKHANSSRGEILMAIVCDGMGGLSKGELASATVIREFSQWFDQELPKELERLDMKVLSRKWEIMLMNLNLKILEYGKKIGENLGTTFTGVLFINDQYFVVHVGDTRFYRIGDKLEQITQDQTFIQREINRGTMTVEQAKTDRRRNMLLQCVGASKTISPAIIYGHTQSGVYLLCSDGFRHEITQEEIYEHLNPSSLVDKASMQKKTKHLIELVKQRKERDNITAILIKTI